MINFKQLFNTKGTKKKIRQIGGKIRARNELDSIFPKSSQQLNNTLGIQKLSPNPQNITIHNHYHGITPEFNQASQETQGKYLSTFESKSSDILNKTPLTRQKGSKASNDILNDILGE